MLFKGVGHTLRSVIKVVAMVQMNSCWAKKNLSDGVTWGSTGLLYCRGMQLLFCQ